MDGHKPKAADGGTEQTITDLPEPRETVERVETGYRLRIESTRGTGTRNEDTVRAEARTETLDELDAERARLRTVVIEEMAQLRSHQPDTDE